MLRPRLRGYASGSRADVCRSVSIRARTRARTSAPVDEQERGDAAQADCQGEPAPLKDREERAEHRAEGEQAAAAAHELRPAREGRPYPGRRADLGSRPQPEERLVERCDQLLAGNPRGAFRRGRAGRRPPPALRAVAVEKRTKGDQEILAVACGLTQEHGSASQPRSLIAPEECFERLAELVRAMGARVEERELPAVERFEQVVGGACAAGSVARRRVEP